MGTQPAWIGVVGSAGHQHGCRGPQVPSTPNRLTKPGRPEPPEADTGRGTHGYTACQPAVQKHDLYGGLLCQQSAQGTQSRAELAQDKLQKVSQRAGGTAARMTVAVAKAFGWTHGTEGQRSHKAACRNVMKMASRQHVHRMQSTRTKKHLPKPRQDSSANSSRSCCLAIRRHQDSTTCSLMLSCNRWHLPPFS